MDLRQYAVTATLGRTFGGRWSYRVSAGAVLDGSLDEGMRHHDVGPGVVVAAGVARQWRREAWFITGTAALAFSRVTTTEVGGDATPLIALDGRVGAQAGRAFGPVSPYVLARAFGGPVWWTVDDDDATGTDVYHFQLGAGASLAAGPVIVVLDASLLGERAVALSLAVQR